MRRPRDVAELAALLQSAERAGRRVTFRAGGMSIHDQSLNTDMVVSMEHFDALGPVDVEAQLVTVGAGARWGDIVDHTLAHGLVPYVVVTSERITCGGSLSTDAISRYTPSFGCESTHVVNINVLTVGATEPRTLRRPDPDDRTSDDAQLFHAVIGGFGLLGAIVGITYRLLRVSNVTGAHGECGPLEVTTKLIACDSFQCVIDKQLQVLEEPIDEDLDRWVFPKQADALGYPSVYTVAFMHRPEGRGAVFVSNYSRAERGRPYLIFRPGWWFRKVIGLVAGVHRAKPLLNRAVWWSMRRAAAAGRTFVNRVRDYTFFMDGDVMSREYFERAWHRSMPVLEQTYVVHYDKAARFMFEMCEMIRRRGIEPGLIELLFMPRNRTLLSASHDMPGFAITIAFLDLEDEQHRRQVILAFEEISAICHRDFGGRIHFTKNVYAAPEVITGMFGERAAAFLRLKRRYDPKGILRNEFFHRLFPEA